MGRAEDLFQRLEAGGASYVDELIATRKGEEAFMDFKRSANEGVSPRLHDHDRNSFAKALSGFANSEGGVIVWGIDCSADGAGADIARAKFPLVDAARFVSSLDGATSGLTVPPVQGTRSIAIPIDGRGGFAATLIPRSSHAPHQWLQEKRYYIRAGSSFEPVPHGVLAGLFGRHPQPVVFPNFLLSPMKVSNKQVSVDATIMLVNDGSVVAEDLFTTVFVSSTGGEGSKFAFRNLPNDTSLFRLTGGVTGRDMAAMGSREFRLPPGAFVQVLGFTFTLFREPTEGFSMNIRAGCSSAPPYFKEMRVERDQLREVYLHACKHGGEFESRLQIDWHAAAARMIGEVPHWRPGQ